MESISHIFILKNSNLVVISTKVIEIDVSDHYPVEAIIKLN